MSKPKIALLLFILLLGALTFFFAGRAKADTFQTYQYLNIGLTFTATGPFSPGEEILLTNIPYRGGVLEGTLYFEDAQLNSLLDLFAVISYPADFVQNPNLYEDQQWPFDIFLYGPMAVAPPIPQVQAVTTPEPSTVWLVGLCALFMLMVYRRRYV